MPPINPAQLLNALGPLLSDTGGIKGPKEASKIIGLMKVATKLVNKCIYLNILRVTQSQEALEKFISLGGWDTLNLWLDTARNNNNFPLVGELLEVYLNLPVTVILLKQNSAAKTIKHLSKNDNEKIKILSGQLVERWTQTIRSQSNTDNENEDKKKKKKHKDKEKDKDKKESKEDNESSEKLKNRDSSKKHQSSRDRKERDSKDGRDGNRDSKDKDRDRHKERSRHKSGSENRESKDSKDSKNISTSEEKNLLQPSATNNDVTESAQPSNEGDIPRRLKTVRKVGDKFRSTGLFDDDDDDEDDKEMESVKKKIIEKPSAGFKRSGSDKTDEYLEKKPRLLLTMPPINPTSLEGTGGNTSTTPPEITHGRIKLIAPKKAPAHEIHESNVFMDALQQSTSYTHGGMKRKKKLPGTSPSGPHPLVRQTSSSGMSPPSSITATSPPAITTTSGHTEPSSLSPPLLSPTSAMAQKLPSVPSFYRDTLDDLPESKEPEKTAEDSDSEKEEDPPQLEMMDISQEESKEEEDQSTNTEELKETGDQVMANLPQHTEDKPQENTVENDTMTEQHNRSKKKVSWASDIRLEEVFYFEMDEMERENVNRPRSFNQMKREEMMLDRRAMDAAKRLVNDNMVEVLLWRTPRVIDNAIVVVEAGCNSQEREIQMEREKSVLCALFFNKVPDTPKEPEPDIPGEQADTKDIPLEDENGSCTIYEHTYNQSDPSSLPYDPEFDHPVQNQGPLHQQQMMGGGGLGGMGGGINGPMNGAGGGFGGMSSMPPVLSHLLNTLQQQARDNLDPVMANMQRMLANVVQTSNSQDSNQLMERILNTVEPFRHQIPGLNNLINSVMNSGIDNGGNPRGYMGNQGGPPRSMGAPRHGLLGPHPPGFNMMSGGGGGNSRGPNMAGPGPMVVNANGGGGGGGEMNKNYYNQGPGNMENMRMERGSGGGGREGGRVAGGREGGRGGSREGGGHWRGKSGGGREGGGGGGRRGFSGKRGRNRSQICQHFINKGCKYGDNCSFIHPSSGPNTYDS